MAPKSMVWRNGILYFNVSGVPSRIMSVPDSGGAMTTLVDDAWGEKLWVEGEDLVYATNDTLYAVPFAGGPPRVLAKGNTPLESAGVDAWIPDLDLDDGFLYWETLTWGKDGQDLTVARVPRSGGAAQPLADLGVSQDALMSLKIVGDDLVLTGDGGKAYAMPKAGGPTRALAAQDSAGVLVGIDSVGPIWRGFSADLHTTLVCADTEGGSSELWPTKPPAFTREFVAPAAEMLIAGGTEKFSDGANHTSIFALDAAGSHGDRIACSPGEDSEDTAVRAVTASPTAYFVAVESFGAGPLAWSVVRIPR
jgi:hypothetical protein